jgi:hypothetical protein
MQILERVACMLPRVIILQVQHAPGMDLVDTTMNVLATMWKTSSGPTNAMVLARVLIV